MIFLMLTGIAQFVYCFGVTNYPFNAFIGGCVQRTLSVVPVVADGVSLWKPHSFAATVGQFVLCGALRIQSNPANKETFPTLSPERCALCHRPALHSVCEEQPLNSPLTELLARRAFGDFLFASMLLHFFVWNYLG